MTNRRRKFQFAFAGWVLCLSSISSVPLQAGLWEGFQPAGRYTSEAPVICFSENKGINAKLSGFAVGTNGNGVKTFQRFADGVFQKQTAIPGGFAVSVDMNYFNADSIPDIVVPSYWGGSFTVYMGASDGSFVPGETYPVEGHCTWVITADFNEDGKTDIAAAHNGSGQPLNLYIYLGDGTGRFTRFQKYPTQLATPTEVILADVNNDKHIDIAYSLAGPDCGAVFLGNGDGTFKDPALIGANDSSNGNGNSQGFSLVDINSDGNVDWIAAQDFRDSIIIKLGDGTGKFVPDTSLYFPHAFDIETADLDGDGTIDIIASNLDSVVFFLQDTHGTFTPAGAMHFEHGPVKLLVLDMNRDGLPDIAVSDLDSAFSVAINRGSPSAGVNPVDPRPSDAVLFQNWPNPFNPSTTIRYGLAVKSNVTLTFFNALGQQVATLVEGEKDAGYHDVKFNAAGLSSGAYFYRLSAGDIVQTRRLLLLR